MKWTEKLKRASLFATFSVAGFLFGYDAIPMALGNSDTLVNYLFDIFGELPVTLVAVAGMVAVRRYI